MRNQLLQDFLSQVSRAQAGGKVESRHRSADDDADASADQDLDDLGNDSSWT